MMQTPETLRQYGRAAPLRQWARLMESDGRIAALPNSLSAQDRQIAPYGFCSTLKQLSASKFKEQCLSLLDRVDPEGIVVTKRGKPVAKLIPFGADSADLIGSLKGKLRIKGQIISTGIRWDAER